MSMAGTDVIVAPVTVSESGHSYVQWGPIIGGAFIATAISTIMTIFGSAIGLSMISADFDRSSNATGERRRRLLGTDAAAKAIRGDGCQRPCLALGRSPAANLSLRGSQRPHASNEEMVDAEGVGHSSLQADRDEEGQGGRRAQDRRAPPLHLGRWHQLRMGKRKDRIVASRINPLTSAILATRDVPAGTAVVVTSLFRLTSTGTSLHTLRHPTRTSS